MSWLNRFGGLFRGEALNRDLEEELQFHLDRQSAANVASGDSPEEARNAALKKFGSRTLMKERMREANIITWIETVLQDLRYALRGLWRSPGFAVTAILSLALGIGAAISIFTIVDDLLLRPLPYRDPSQLVMLWEEKVDHNSQHVMDSNSPGNYFDWKAQNKVFEAVAAFRALRGVLNDGVRSEELSRQAVTSELLPMLGIQPVRGRLFTAAEDRPGVRSDQVLLISYSLWQNWFGGDENVTGRRVQVNGIPRTIIGVMPPGFYFRDREVDLWEPLGLNPAQDYRKTSGRYISTIARLKPGLPVERARIEMAAIAKRLETAYPFFNSKYTVAVEPLRDSLVREVRTSLLVLLAAVGLLLAVACANVANLLLARHASRKQEMAVRASLGAGRWRVVRQLLTESVLLSLAGGLLGIFLARWMIAGLLALAPRDLTQPANIAIDFRITLVAFGLSAMTGIIFGLAPSLTVSRTDLASALKRSSLRGVLVGAEVAISVMLLVGGSLLFRSLVRIQNVDPGIDPARMLTFRVSLPAARYGDKQRIQFFAQALDRIRQLPGVRSASAVSHLPFAGMSPGTWVYIDGKPMPRPGEELVIRVRTVMPEYFRTMGIAVHRGRVFSDADNSAQAPYRFIVNEAFERQFLGGEDAIGKTIRPLMNAGPPLGDAGEVIGVVADVKEGSLDKAAMPTVYYMEGRMAYAAMVFAVRTEGNPMTLVDPVRRAIRGIDRAQPIAQVRTMEDVIGQTFARQRFSAILLAGFSIAALLLGAVGIYGVLAYSVSARTREVGLRIALGAHPRKIVRLVVGNGLRLALAGTAAGTAGALAISSFLKSLLFDVSPRDPLTFLAVPAVLLVVALIAAWVPARRASRIDPMQALRAQ